MLTQILLLLLLIPLFAGAALMLFNLAMTLLTEKLAPPQGRLIDLDGQRLHVVDSGDKPGQSAPPLFFIHGLLGQSRNFSFALTELFPERRVVLIDRPGAGHSPDGPAHTLAAQAALAARVIEKLGLEKPLVVGHSLGGAIALELALDHPRCVGGLALIAPLTHELASPPKPFDTLALPDDWKLWLGFWTLAPLVTAARAPASEKLIFAPEAPLPAFALRGGGALSARPSALLAACRDVEQSARDMAALEARYGALSVPTGVLFGAGDALLDPKIHGEVFCARAPNAELTLLDGGHMLPVTQPAATAAFIRKMLARVDSA